MSRLLLVVFLVATACSQPPHVVLVIEDATGTADAASRVVVIRDDGRESSTPTGGKTFPFTVTVTAETGGTTASVWVEARDAGTVLARGRTRLEFPASGGGRGTVRLFAACAGADGPSCAREAPIGETGVCVRGGCAQSSCGDGFADAENDEECDDGNDTDQDACRSNCRLARCGDDVIRIDIIDAADPDFEECDDGALNSDESGCTLACRTNVCGDGKLQVGRELCEVDVAFLPVDYAHLDVVNTGDCIVEMVGTEPRCVPASCGDGWVWAGAEACDHGGQAAACTVDCAAVPSCGNLVVEPDNGGGGEQCDDGNGNPNDGCDGCREVAWVPSVAVGLPNGGGVPSAVQLTSPTHLAAAPDGVLYVSVGHQVFRYDPRGSAGAILTPFAGTGVRGYSGDGGLARAAQLATPLGIAVDQRGFVYIADEHNEAIRVVREDGTIDTAIAVPPNSLQDVVISPAGDMIYTSSTSVRWTELDASGIATGGSGAIPTMHNGPATLAVAPNGTIYVARNDTLTMNDGGAYQLMSSTCTAGPCGDGGGLSAAGADRMDGLAVDLDGNLYVSDAGLRRVRRITATAGIIAPDSIITPVAGTGASCDVIADPGCGDGGAALDATMAAPREIALDLGGRLYVADSELHRIRAIDLATNTIEAVAGSGAPLALPSQQHPLHVSFPQPSDLGFDPTTGRILIASPFDGRLRAIDRLGPSVEIIAGTGLVCVSDCGDGGLATEASIGGIYDVVRAPGGRLVVATGTGVYRIDTDGTIHRILSLIGTAVAVDAAGNIYALDWHNEAIWMAAAVGGVVPSDATAVDWAGRRCDPDCASEGIPLGVDKAVFPLGDPVDLVWDGGNLYILDREWNTVIRIVVATGRGGLFGECVLSADCDQPQAIGTAGNGDLMVVDGTWLRRLDSAGTFHTIAGSASAVTSGDRGPLASATFSTLVDAMAISASEWVLVQEDGFVRLVWDGGGTWMIDTIAGPVYPGDGPRDEATLDSPVAIAAQVGGAADDSWLVTDAGLGRVRRIPYNLDVADELVTVAGHPVPATALLAFGDADPARVHRRLQASSGLAFDAATDSIFVVEQTGHLVSRIQASAADIEAWTMGPFLGEFAASGWIDGAGDAARLAEPSGLALDALRRALYLADTGNHVVRRIDLVDGPPPSASITTVVGIPGQAGVYAVDGAPAGAVHLDSPSALAVTDTGTLFVADTGNHRVLRVEPAVSGVIETDSVVSVVIGVDGEASSYGDGAPARALPVDTPRGLAIDGYGNLLVASRDALRLVTPSSSAFADGDGTVHTLLGRGGGFLDSLASCLEGVAVTDATATSDRIYVLDACEAVWFTLDRQ